MVDIRDIFSAVVKQLVPNLLGVFDTEVTVLSDCTVVMTALSVLLFIYMLLVRLCAYTLSLSCEFVVK